MINLGRLRSSPLALAAGAATLVALGAAGGAGAVQMIQPSIEMAPTIPIAIARLGSTSGVVTVKGRVAEVYGDRFLLQDRTGRALIAVRRDRSDGVTVGQPMMVQGRFADGQLRATYLVDQSSRITAVGPRAPGIGGGEGPAGGRPHGPDRHGPPQPGCAPVPGDRGDFEPADASPPPPSPPPNGAVSAKDQVAPSPATPPVALADQPAASAGAAQRHL
jgi:hypothetical protein